MAAPPQTDGRSTAVAGPTSMVARVTRILEVFAGPYDRLPLAEVSARAGLPVSTTHRILGTLTAHGWVEQTANVYRLGRRTRRFDEGGQHLHLRSIAHPYMHALHVRTGWTVCLSTLVGDDAVCVDRIGGGPSADAAHSVGGRHRVDLCTPGRAMLAVIRGGGAEGGATSGGTGCVAAAFRLPDGRCSAVCLHPGRQTGRLPSPADRLVRTVRLIAAEFTVSRGPGHRGTGAAG